MELLDWVYEHPAALGTLGTLSVVTFISTLVLLPVVVGRMPEDYFVGGNADDFAHRRPAVRMVLVVLKNLLGGALLVAGLLMLVLPGQGILTVLIGITLLSFPGKRRLELWLANRRSVRRAIGWLRRRAGRPPLLYPPTS